MTFQPAPKNSALQLLDNLPVAAHRPVESLKIAVDDEGEIVEIFPRCQRQGGDGLRFIHFSIAEHTPNMPIRWCRRACELRDNA